MFENNNKNQIMEIFKNRPNFRSKSLYINNKNLKPNNIYNLKSKNIINNNIKYNHIKNNKNNIKNIQSSIITQNKTDLNKDIKKK